MPPLCSYSQLVELASPWPGELAKGPPCPPSLPPPLVSQCEAHGPPIGVGREKKVRLQFVGVPRLNLTRVQLQRVNV